MPGRTAVPMYLVALVWMVISASALRADVFGPPSSQSARFDAYAYYRPYKEVIALDYRLKGEAVPEGTTICLQLEAQKDAKVIFERKWPAKNGRHHLAAQCRLPQGGFTARVSVLKPGEKGELYAVNNRITRRHYPFEKNDIGRQREVIPPFEPVRVREDSARVWGRRIVFGDGGLPERIDVQGTNILRGGIGMNLRIGDEVHTPDPAETATPETEDGYDAHLTSSGTIGPLDYRLVGRLEYDGFYLIRLAITPPEEPVTVERLSLVIPLWDGADTYRFQKNDIDTRIKRRGKSRFDGISPSQQGVIFDARDLPAASSYGLESDNSFVPAIYVGSGSRGLWYYAVQDFDRYLNPEKEHAVLERTAEGLHLRVPMVNDRLAWARRRVFEFALMAQPVKPAPQDRRKIEWAYPRAQYVHDTAGWRYYGDGVNSFSLPDDEAYRALGRVFSGRDDPADCAHPGAPSKDPDDPRPLVIYGSSLMAGWGHDAWETYAPEWVGPKLTRHRDRHSVRDRFEDECSYAGYPWEEDDAFRPTAVHWTDSWLDFFVYHHRKLVNIAGINGTWFDNMSVFTIPAFDEEGFERHHQDMPGRYPAEERVINYGRRYNLFQFRKLTRRLATMCHADGVQPFWMVNMHPTWSFCQIAWQVEHDFSVRGDQRDLVDSMGGVDEFRAHMRTQGGLIHFLASNGGGVSPPVEGRPDHYVLRPPSGAFPVPEAYRAELGLCILHDVGNHRGYGHAGLRAIAEFKRRLDERFDFFAPDVRYAGYWEQKGVSAEDPNFYVSLYYHEEGSKALAVVFNEQAGESGVTTRLEIDAAELRSTTGISAPSVEDLETHEPLRDLEGASGIQTLLYVPNRDFRLLLLSAGTE